MQQAIVLPMPTDREEKEQRYLQSNDAVNNLRKQVDGLTSNVIRIEEKLSASIERIKEAIIGDEMGNAGLLTEIKIARAAQDLITKRMDDLEKLLYQQTIDGKERSRNWAILGVCGGTFLGIIMKFLMDKFK